MTSFPKHLVSMDQLDRVMIESIIEKALAFIDKQSWQIKQNRCLAHKTVVNMFYEPSTRTQMSFQLAAQYLGARTVLFNQHVSSEHKGEHFLDSVMNIAAMWVDALVLRHPDESVLAPLLPHLPKHMVLLNAGNGSDEHPTQALLDAAAIYSHFPHMDQLKIAIVGDSRHSRAAHSQIKCFQSLGVKDLVLVGPSELLPADIAPGTVHAHALDVALEDCDVVMVLRLQKERMTSDALSFADQYAQHYQLSKAHLSKAKPHALVMHPGPMNRGIELSDDVADGPQSFILKQVGYGVAMRMALLAEMLQD